MKSRLLGAVCACVLFLLSQAAHAIAVYTYQGNEFDTFFDDDPPSGNLNDSQSLSVTLTYSDPLLNKPYGSSPPPIAYSFSDGITTIDNSSNPEIVEIKFSTNASSEILEWEVVVQERNTRSTDWSVGDTTRQMRTRALNRTIVNPVSDHSAIFECISLRPNNECLGLKNDVASNQMSPAQWNLTIIPIPPALYLFGSGLLGIVSIARRKKAA